MMCEYHVRVTKLDLVKGYHLVPVAKADIPKTTILMSFGMYEYLCVPFGLKNAAQTFQRLMDHQFASLPHLFTYLDDNKAVSVNMASHLELLRSIFTILQDNGLQLNIEKCAVAQPEVVFLGRVVNATSLVLLPLHAEAVAAFPQPLDITGMQRFLGTYGQLFQTLHPGSQHPQAAHGRPQGQPQEAGVEP